MAISTPPRTAAATVASVISRARRRAADPDKRDHATLTVAAGLVAGTITVDDLAARIHYVTGSPEHVAASARPPGPERIERLRALLPPVADRPSGTEARAA